MDLIDNVVAIPIKHSFPDCRDRFRIYERVASFRMTADSYADMDYSYRTENLEETVPIFLGARQRGKSIATTS